MADVLAQAEGFLSLSLIALIFIFYPIVSTLYYQTIFNELYTTSNPGSIFDTYNSPKKHKNKFFPNSHEPLATEENLITPKSLRSE